MHQLEAMWMWKPQFKKEITVGGDREVGSKQHNKEEEWERLENILLQ